MSQRRRKTAMVLAFCLGLWGPAAVARPAHKKALADYVGGGLAKKLNDCRTCHLKPEEGAESEDARPHNAFGKRLKAVRAELKRAGKRSDIPTRVDAIGDEDSDGDGVSNLVELLTGHFPGDADDRPEPSELAKGQEAAITLRRSSTGYVWSPFERVVRPRVPEIRSKSWNRNAIDGFIAAEHEARGLTPRPEASRPALLRRVYVDLIGLPPTPEELHAFVADESADAYERVVERLLASPQYGERWGRHWMDVWRYSDWAGWGQQVRDSQPHIWHWRDWIVESLNDDRPYDRMVVAMLAADEAWPDDADALRATGYLARNYKLLSREKWMQDTVEHTTQAFLGVTLGCARCHDHMYDPMLQKEYYQFRAIFEPHQVRIDRVPGTVDVAKDGLPRVYDAQPDAKTLLFVRGDDRNPTGKPLSPGVPEFLGVRFPVIERVALPKSATAPDRRPAVIHDQIEALAAASARTEQALAAVRAGSKDAEVIERAEIDAAVARGELDTRRFVEVAEAIVADGKKGTEEWKQAAVLASAAERRLALAVARRNELSARQARNKAPASKRAEADKAHATATKDVLAKQAALGETRTDYAAPAFTTYPGSSTGRRLGLARWITDPAHPLTARVAVNHLWGRHFGRAIVPSVNDFGRNGQRPSHPALLDWLAAELLERRWSMKEIHRLIVTSATYRQDSRPDERDLAVDPDNVYLWRWTPRRVEAEVVRDCLFWAGGSLETTMGGPSIDHHAGLTIARRSLYFQHAAEKQMEFLQIFDVAGVTECYRRKESILPQQALALANSELSLRQARRLASALTTTAGSDAEAFVTAAFEHVLTRAPTDGELRACLEFLGAASAGAELGRVDPGSSVVESPDPALQRRRQSLVHVLLNHHDFVTLR